MKKAFSEIRKYRTLSIHDTQQWTRQMGLLEPLALKFGKKTNSKKYLWITEMPSSMNWGSWIDGLPQNKIFEWKFTERLLSTLNLAKCHKIFLVVSQKAEFLKKLQILFLL